MLLLLLLATPLLLINYALYWAFKTPEVCFSRSRQRMVIALIALFTLAITIFGIFSKDHTYSVLFYTYPLTYAILLRRRVRAVLAPAAHRPVTLYLVLIALLWPKELFVVGDSGNPALTHLAFYLGYYLGIALVITVLYRRWHYTARQVFVVGGLWGVLIEQNFAGPTILLSGDILGFVVFGAFVFVVYGLYLAGPHLLFYEEFSHVERTHPRQRVILFAAIVILPLITWLTWALVVNALGLDSSSVV